MGERLSRTEIGLRALGVILMAFVILVGLRIHGFSLPKWHSVIDGSPAPEVLVGRTRYIRADELIPPQTRVCSFDEIAQAIAALEQPQPTERPQPSERP